MKKLKFSELQDQIPVYHQVDRLNLTVIQYDHHISVFCVRCNDQKSLLANGHIEGDNLICSVHGWDYRYDTNVSEYNNEEVLHKIHVEIQEDHVYVNNNENY